MDYGNNILISIIIPVYNGEKSLNKCIDSIHGQSFKDYEIILVNDGSTDNSLDLCNDLAKKDARIIVIDKKNGGAGSARNAGIEIAHGKYIYFLDSDDEISDTLLKTVFEQAENHDADLVVFAINRKIINSDNGQVIRSIVSPQRNISIETNDQFVSAFSKLYYDGVLFGGPVNKLFLKEIIYKNNIRFPDLRRGQDEIFNLYYYKYINKCVIIPDVLYTYNAYDEKSKRKKYRLNYFETTKIKYYNELMDLFKHLHIDDEYTREKLQKSFVYSFEEAIMLAWNPLEKLNKTQKKEFIKKLFGFRLTGQMIETITYIPEGYERFWQIVRKYDVNRLYGFFRRRELKEKIKNLKIVSAVYRMLRRA